ncbi:MAG: hypothetical protein VKS61_01110 [Candidatus Sericytochromatia bacterium]|nr:hypothetical protein [Candidatus Sericytochromatia bacterium]
MSSAPINPTRPVAATAAPAGIGERAKRIAGLAGTRMTRDQFVSEVKVGMVFSAPMEGVFESQKFRKGEIKANEYVGRVLANTLSTAAWTAGGALAGAALAPVGMPLFVAGAAGFAFGMVANDLWDRTFGTQIVEVFKEKVTDAQARPAAEAFVTYVANPLHDWVWKPVSGFVGQHKVLSGVLLTLAALRFPFAAKAVGKEVGKMAVGTAAALGVQLAVTDRVLAPAAHRQESQAPAPAAQGR